MSAASREGRASGAATAPEPVHSPRPIRHVAPVLENRPVARATWWLELDSPEIAAASRPGQFVMIGYGLEDAGTTLLPRPFSVGWRGPDGRVGLLLRAYGAGTRRMARLREGEEMLLLGPLGRPFRLEGRDERDGGLGGGAERREEGAEASIETGRRIVCVAGGVGLAPFLFLANEARRAGREVALLYGERAGAYVFDPSLIRELTGGPVEVWTEDGAVGRQGRVTEGVDLSDDPLLLACGPTPMLQAMARTAVRQELDLQVAVEEYMGCGVGTCQGCVVRGVDGDWRKACTEGPVFDAEELDWS